MVARRRFLRPATLTKKTPRPVAPPLAKVRRGERDRLDLGRAPTRRAASTPFAHGAVSRRRDRRGYVGRHRQGARAVARARACACATACGPRSHALSALGSRALARPRGLALSLFRLPLWKRPRARALLSNLDPPPRTIARPRVRPATAGRRVRAHVRAAGATAARPCRGSRRRGPLRDLLTIGAAFTVPAFLSRALVGARVMEPASADEAAQLLSPIGMQVSSSQARV